MVSSYPDLLLSTDSSCLTFLPALLMKIHETSDQVWMDHDFTNSYDNSYANSA